MVCGRLGRSRGENLAIINSDRAGYTAAIYARRAQLKPVIFEGAYCQARQRLPENLLQQLYRQVAQDLEKKTSVEY